MVRTYRILWKGSPHYVDAIVEARRIRVFSIRPVLPYYTEATKHLRGGLTEHLPGDDVAFSSWSTEDLDELCHILTQSRAAV